VAAVGQSFVIPESALAAIQAAATPRKRRLGGTVDEFWDVLERDSVARIEFAWDGYVLATLLPFLQEQSIDLMHSDHDEAGQAVVNARSMTAFVLTKTQRENYVDRLDPERFDEETLQRYYEEFNETDGAGVGAAMRDGIAFFRDTLAALTSTTVALFIIA
jgi:hypothetical protein